MKSSADVFWLELSRKTRLYAEARGTSAQQELLQYVLHRILARNFSLHPDRWLLKGGQTLLARFPDARATADVDLVGLGGNGRAAMVADFNDALKIDLDDHLTFEPLWDHKMLHGEAARVSHRVRCGDRELMDIETDLVPPNGRPYWRPPELIQFPAQLMETGADGERPMIRAFSLHDQLAHKVNGMYTQNLRNDETKCLQCTPRVVGGWQCLSGEMPHRGQDLVDVTFLAQKVNWDAAETHAAIRHEFEVRHAQGEPVKLPNRFRIPNPDWVQMYSKYAAVTPGLPAKSLRDAWPLADAFITPLIQQEAPAGSWDTERLIWAGAAESAAGAEPVRQRILVVSDASGRTAGRGGAPVTSGELTRALAELPDTEVTLLTIEGTEEHGKARIVEIPRDESVSRIGQLSIVAVRDWPEQIPGLPGASSDSYDAVIGHSRYSGPAAKDIRNRWYPFAALVHVVHTDVEQVARLYGDAERGRSYAERERAALDSSDLVVGVGPLLTEHGRQLLADGDREPSYHELIPGGLGGDLLASPESADSFRLLFTAGGGLREIKGYDDLLATIDRLRGDGVAVSPRVRGLEPNRVAAFQGEADEAVGSRGVVECLPYTSDRATLREDHAWTHALVMPSRVEGFGIVAHEAAQRGVPVLVPERTGIGQFLADTDRFPARIGWASVVADGGLAGPARVEAWAAAISELRADYPQRRRGAAELRDALRPYTWSSAAGALREAIRHAKPDARRTTLQTSDGRAQLVLPQGERPTRPFAGVDGPEAVQRFIQEAASTKRSAKPAATAQTGDDGTDGGRRHGVRQARRIGSVPER